MPPELLNINEISKIIASTTPGPDHSALVEALNARYPATPFRLLQEYDGRTWNVGVIDQTGERIADHLGRWIDQQLALTSGSAEAVWNKFKNAGLTRTERVGSCLYLVAPFGPDQDQFYQLEILCGAEMTTQKLFDPKPILVPEDRHDLLSGPCLMFADDARMELAPEAYQFEKLTNIRRFLRDLAESKRLNNLGELAENEGKTVHIQEIVLEEGTSESYEIPWADMEPGWLDRLPPALRLFQDWAESSAGKEGHRLSDHWWLECGEWVEKGRRQYSLIPQWAQADGGLDLPEISPGWEASPYGVMEELKQFDARVGYPFAWYFYCLHGNRITHSAAGVIANAVKDGLLNLPEHDEKVLLRWREAQYGF